MKIIKVPRKEILRDFFFCFSSESNLSGLKNSVSASGILNPLFVITAENGYKIISGFKRFKVAEELKIDLIPVVVKTKNIKLKNFFKNALLEHLSCNGLNIIEKARVLLILERLDVSWYMLLNDFLPIIELPNTKEAVGEVKEILAFSSKAQEYIEKYNLSLKQIRIFQKLNSIEQDVVAGLGLDLQIRSVELYEIIKILWEISQRENESLEKIYINLKIDTINKNENYSRNEKIDKIKKTLKERRYPRITLWNKELTDFQRELELPSNINFSWDHSLEATGIQLNVNIKSVNDVKEILSYLSQKKNQEVIEKMLRIV